MNFSRVAMLTLLGFSPGVLADVDLVTIPTRDGVQLTIYNSDDITMVREHRLLTVKKGINRIQFRRADTLIDPTSIDFRILDHLGQVDLMDTTFPSGRNDALQWNIQSEMAGKLPVEIRYFTSGVTWKADYVGIANQDETKLNVTGYVRVFNGSGELYDNAQVRLVVGTINLVEKIADLATRPPPDTSVTVVPLYSKQTEDTRRHMRFEFNKAVDSYADRWGVVTGDDDGAKEVVKQGLSEYFLFTIEGREGKPEDWDSQEAGAYVDLHAIDGRVERVDQNHVKYFQDLAPGEKRLVRYSVTYKRRKVGPELNAAKKREPL